jgi:hypothetical protein
MVLEVSMHDVLTRVTHLEGIRQEDERCSALAWVLVSLPSLLITLSLTVGPGLGLWHWHLCIKRLMSREVIPPTPVPRAGFMSDTHRDA